MDVLVCDDDAATRLVVKRLIEADTDARVAECCDGAAALSYLAHHACDLLILDIEMPHVDGLEVVARLRESPMHKRLPIVILSHVDNEATIRELIGMHVAGYILKPPRRPQVAAMVRRVREAGPLLRILVVEGDPSLREATVEQLRPFCTTIAAAPSGLEALVAFRSAPAQVVVVGEGLGIMNPRLLAERLREVVPADQLRLVRLAAHRSAAPPPPYDAALALEMEANEIRGALHGRDTRAA